MRYDFYKNVVLTGGEVALHHFGDFLQLLNYVIELRGVAQEETNVCTGIVSYSGRVNKALRSFDDTIGNQALYPLVYCGTGYSAFTGDFKVGLTGVLRQSDRIRRSSSSKLWRLILIFLIINVDE